MAAMPRPLIVLLAAAFACLAFPGCSRAPQRNVVLIVVDTLRADALGAYGYGGPDPVSPAIDALAARGWTFERHVAHAAQTVPSMLSLMTSQLPAEHGFQHHGIGKFQAERPVYPETLTFFAEALRDAGYVTAGFVSNPFLGPESGFGQGFDHFESRAGPGPQLTRLAETWLAAWGRDRDAPFLLYVHYMDVHQPYLPSREAQRRFVGPERGVQLAGNRRVLLGDPRDFAYTRRVYQACVADLDAQVGALVRAVDALGVGAETVIALTSDHGEEFGEHGGVGHGTTVYGELVRVPLVLVAQGRLEPGRRVAHLSQQMDLAPTLLDLAGVARPASFRGESVLAPAEAAIVDDGSWRGVYAEDRKLVWNRETGAMQLFDAVADPLDARPIADPGREAALRKRIDAYVAREPAPREPAASQVPSWSAEERERLRALGYAQ
jgi:arylsulfatase A-like enzyme